MHLVEQLLSQFFWGVYLCFILRLYQVKAGFVTKLFNRRTKIVFFTEHLYEKRNPHL